MQHPLTIAYMTCRQKPMIEWFLSSFNRELQGNYDGISVKVISLHDIKIPETSYKGPISVHQPMPCVWQGPYRLTKRDYFAASNARNTALCLAPRHRVYSYIGPGGVPVVYPSTMEMYDDGWIAYVDDLSVLMPGWMNSVREAMAGNYIVFGAYKKVLKLFVDEDGNSRYEEFPPGVDSRWDKGDPSKPVPAAGSWMFGCSLAAPVEAFLKIGGFDSACDSLGSEDYIAGIMLERAGYSFRYDRRMLTLESEERHHDGSALPRFDKGVSPNDKSHAILNMVLKGGRNVAPGYWGEGGIRSVREAVLSGKSFPIVQIPEHDWFDGQPLREL